jgi:hypothetical protein
LIRFFFECYGIDGEEIVEIWPVSRIGSGKALLKMFLKGVKCEINMEFGKNGMFHVKHWGDTPHPFGAPLSRGDKDPVCCPRA